jgi:tRNA pseudouridine38-40 synthase
MRNIRLTIQYDGTHYAGWQTQKNAKTVQSVLEHAIKRVTGRKPALIGSGRTDSGVHAMAQVANFRTISRMPAATLIMALNAHLPRDIVVTDVSEAPIKFHAQHSAKSKLYRYTIANTNFVSPFVRHYAAKCYFSLDIERMKRAARCLLGRHDFKSFMASNSYETKTMRTIKKIRIEKKDELIFIDVEADGFLYNMVRNIAGTLIEIGRGKMEVKEMKNILAKKDRAYCGPKAPACGLCLMKVKY